MTILSHATQHKAENTYKAFWISYINFVMLQLTCITCMDKLSFSKIYTHNQSVFALQLKNYQKGNLLYT